MQLKALAAPPSLTRNLEAKIESQRYEIQSLQRDLQTTQASLNSLNEVNLNSIQGVCVDETVAASTSSVSILTERAFSHPPQAGSDPELFLQRENTILDAASKLAAAQNTMRAEINSNDFGSFWNQLADSNSIFFVAKIIFFERFEFLVCSKFNRTHHVAVNVLVLWLVCTHRIPIRMLLRP